MQVTKVVDNLKSRFPLVERLVDAVHVIVFCVTALMVNVSLTADPVSTTKEIFSLIKNPWSDFVIVKVVPD